MHVFQCRHVVSCCGVRINCHRLLQWWRVIGSYGLQHHWAVRICHPRDWSDHSAADGRQHQEHNVLWAAVRGPRARSLSRCLPRASGRRTGSRRTALLETLVSLPVTGDDGQVDEAAAWEDGLDVTNERRSSCVFGELSVSCCPSTLFFWQDRVPAVHRIWLYFIIWCHFIYLFFHLMSGYLLPLRDGQLTQRMHRGAAGLSPTTMSSK